MAGMLATGVPWEALMELHPADAVVLAEQLASLRGRTDG